MSAGQTFRSEDNAFMPLSPGPNIRFRCRSEFCQSCEKLCQAAQRSLKQHTRVSSRLQIHPSPAFNCGIRVQSLRTKISYADCVAKALRARSRRRPPVPARLGREAGLLFMRRDGSRDLGWRSIREAFDWRLAGRVRARQPDPTKADGRSR
jgi:hypothetical protein